MPRYVPAVLLFATACGSSSPPVSSPAPSSATPSPSSATAEVSRGGAAELAFSGAFALSVSRDAAECQASGGSVGFSARGAAGEPTWWLTVIDDDAGGPHQPSVVLNLGTTSYTWRRDGGVVSAGAAPHVARLDADLRGVGTPGVVRVKGTLSCP